MFLDGFVVCWVVQKIMKDEEDEFIEIIIFMEFYIKKKDILKVMKIDLQFYQFIYKVLKSKLFEYVLFIFYSYIIRVRVIFFEIFGRFEEVMEEYKFIYEVIVSRDFDKVEEYMKFYVKNVVKNLIEQKKSEERIVVGK